MKTVKIKEDTHKILKWIQSQDYLRDLPKDELDIDSIIFKSLVHYAQINRYNLEALKNLIGEDDE